MKTEIFWSVLGCIFSVCSYADIVFGNCELVKENFCVKSSAEEKKYFAIHSKDYLDRQVVWLSEVDSLDGKHIWRDEQEGKSSFYVLAKGTSLRDIEFLDTRDSIYVKLANDSAGKSIREFFQLYEVLKKGRMSEKQFDQAFYGLSFWKKILYGFGWFKDAYLSEKNLQLKSLVFGSSLECPDCLHLVFQAGENRWLVSGKVDKSSSIKVVDVSRLE
ncbi:hypothetical protein ACJJIE_06480 [Microbulbifer sp. TRSA001]|uniref:hypothetical protein n=1 Tax=Microbulbifer sp. TRSA001 TaxID=3243381 RepID=UPI004039BE72